MEGEESLLDAINEEDGFENMEDVDMVDVEEGEIVVDHDLDSAERRNGDGDGVGDKDKEGLLGNKNVQHQPNKNKKKKKIKGPVMQLLLVWRFILWQLICYLGNRNIAGIFFNVKEKAKDIAETWKKSLEESGLQIAFKNV